MKAKGLTSAKVLILLLTFLIVVAIVPATTTTALQGEAKIETNKVSYFLSETVTITGWAFQPETQITVNVSRPDDSTDSWNDVTSDTNGEFVTYYTLDGVSGIYIIKATDGIDTSVTAFYANNSIIWTDKSNYESQETVTIFGSGFDPNGELTIMVSRPDNSKDVWTVSANVSGDFTTTYTLDGIVGHYGVLATDGTKEAITWFSDQLPPIIDDFPIITVSPIAGPPGTTVTVSGSDFGYGQTIKIYFGGYISGVEVQQTSTSAQGSFSTTFDVPDWAVPLRTYIVEAVEFTCFLGFCYPSISTITHFVVLPPDSDGDGWPDYCIVDNCPTIPNPNQEDIDLDDVGDVCDTCPNDAENDADGDGVCGDVDPCPYDALDDVDGDGVCGDVDNCPDTYNPDQMDSDNDGVGDACEAPIPAYLFMNILQILPVAVIAGTLVILRRRRKHPPAN